MLRATQTHRAHPDGTLTRRLAERSEVRFLRCPDLPGVHLLLVQRSTRLWRVYHETYALCAAPRRDNPALAYHWLYRGVELVSHPGHIMLMEPGEVHSSLKLTRPASYFVVKISPDAMKQLIAELGLGSLPHLRVADVVDPILEESLEALRKVCCTDATALARQTQLARVVQLIVERYRESSHSVKLSDPAAKQIRLAHDFLVEHYDQRVTLDDLVRVTGVSRFHLVRAFSKTFGVPPHQFQLLVRISQAQKQLDLGCAPSAIDVGFADQSHLTRHFRRTLGTTPAEYQREIGARPRPSPFKTAA